jgi:hypothetical protein
VRGSVARYGVGYLATGKDALPERSSQGRTNHIGQPGRASSAETSNDQGQPLSYWRACLLARCHGTAILGASCTGYRWVSESRVSVLLMFRMILSTIEATWATCLHVCTFAERS